MDQLKRCPFCNDPMRVNVDRIEHVTQTKGCPMRDLSLPIERLADWNTRSPDARNEALEVLVPRLGQKVQIASHCPDAEQWNNQDWFVVGLTTELGKQGVNVWIGPEYPIASEGPTDGFWVNRWPKPDDLIWSALIKDQANAG